MSERPTARDFLFAIRYLTIVPAGRTGGSLGPATMFFPVIGMLIGAVVAAADLACADLHLPGRALLVVFLLALLGRFQGLRGLARLGGAVREGRDRSAALETMQSATASPGGVALVAAALAAKLWILWNPGSLQTSALVFAPMLARWGMVVVAFSARRARVGAAGPRFEADITFREFGWASVVAGIATLATLEAIGLLAVLGVAAVAVILRLLWHRWLGGVNDATFWASGEIAEVAALALFALFKLR